MKSNKIHDEKTQDAVAEAFVKGPLGMSAEQRAKMFLPPTEAERKAAGVKAPKAPKPKSDQ